MPGPNIVIRGHLDQGFDCLGVGHNGREPAISVRSGEQFIRVVLDHHHPAGVDNPG
jgi:hypothetical protein